MLKASIFWWFGIHKASLQMSSHSTCWWDRRASKTSASFSHCSWFQNIKGSQPWSTCARKKL